MITPARMPAGESGGLYSADLRSQRIMASIPGKPIGTDEIIRRSGIHIERIARRADRSNGIAALILVQRLTQATNMDIDGPCLDIDI